MSSPARFRATSHIGIFWFFRNTLLASTIPIDQGISTGDNVDSPEEHVAVWPRFQKTVPDLRDVDYECIPRGRVVYFIRERTFIVYLDTRLLKAQVKSAILKEFRLPRKQTRFCADVHYTTDPAELSRLFDET